MGSLYRDLPILDAARRCGLVLNDRTLEREEAEASCPFCGDNGPGKYHLSLNTRKNVYRCNLCNASGNSVSLYARMEGVSNRQAFRALTEEGGLYRFPEQPTPKKPPEREPASLARRHDTYYDMLSHLELSPKHRADLLARGLSEERIAQNMYRTLPAGNGPRRFLAGMLADFHDLDGIPGFYVDDRGFWNISGSGGLLAPYYTRDGYIQGMQVRLDDETKPERKYRWLSSRGRNHGTKSRSWIHVTGNVRAKTAYLTEGALKGDVASYLDHDALFLCFAGVNSIGLLKETLSGFSLSEAVIALDMDKLMNWRVQKALVKIQELARGIPGIRVRLMNWNVGFKGVDDFYKARNDAARRGANILDMRSNFITRSLDELWKREYPRQDRGFIHTCEWEELTVPISTLSCEAPEDLEKAEGYLRLLQEGQPAFSPLVCVNRTVIDGRCRFWACQQLGYQEVTIYQNVPWVLPAAA
ncbi:MAG: hypothetical protein HFF18_06265 [Oscillospiraceae bacterium]|nr:hypothetical protein [Oscillospiraceae bacterium]